jgi:hypothetical protein
LIGPNLAVDRNPNVRVVWALHIGFRRRYTQEEVLLETRQTGAPPRGPVRVVPVAELPSSVIERLQDLADLYPEARLVFCGGTKS